MNQQYQNNTDTEGHHQIALADIKSNFESVQLISFVQFEIFLWKVAAIAVTVRKLDFIMLCYLLRD